MINKYTRKKINDSSMIRKMFTAGRALKKKYGEENVYDYSLGNPTARVPKELNDSIVNTLENTDSMSVHGYMPNNGIEEVRSKVAEYENSIKGINIDKDAIIMVTGAAGGLNVALFTLLEEGDEVIITKPYFPEYTNYISNAGGKVIIAECDENFMPNLAHFESCFTKRTKCVIINSPNNPSGVVYSEEIIKKIGSISQKKGLEYGTDVVIISDEPYRELIYTNKKSSSILKHYDNAMTVYSFSKSLSIPGERVGYIALAENFKDKEEVVEGLTVTNRIYGYLNAPSLFQHVIKDIIGVSVDVDYYKKNRDDLIKIMDEVGLDYFKPEGAFYLFVKSPTDDENIFVEEAKKYKLLLVPSSAFGVKGYVRLSYCIKNEVIQKSKEAFKKLMKNL